MEYKCTYFHLFLSHQESPNLCCQVVASSGQWGKAGHWCCPLAAGTDPSAWAADASSVQKDAWLKKIKKIKKNHTGKNWCISYCLGPLNVFNNYYIYSILTVNKINIEISQSMGLRLCCCCCENVLLSRRDVRPENERLIRNNNEQWVA